MQALQLTVPGSPLELRTVEARDPGANEVLIRVAGCGVCHTDVGFWRDGVATRGALPLTLGHEIAGVVVAAGSGAEEMVGREIIVPAVIPCGACALCAAGRGNACRRQIMPGNDLDGGFADYVTVPARGLCVVPERGDHTLAELAVIADAVTTPYQAVVRSGLGVGDLAVVVGVGGVGTYAVQIAAALGAEVIAIDVDPSRLEAVAGYGARLTLDASALPFKELRARVQDEARSCGCPSHGWKIFECSGHPAGQETAFGLLTHVATLMVVGFTMARVNLRLSNLMAFDATAQGTWGCLPELYPAALELVTSGRVAVRPFVRTYPLSDGPEVLRAVADHEIDRRAVLVPAGT